MTYEPGSYSLKDMLFSPERVLFLVQIIQDVYPKLEAKKLEQIILRKFPELELKQRMRHISTCLYDYLPERYEDAIEILINSLKPYSDNDSFIFCVYSDYVAEYGCTKKHLDLSLNALGEFTKVASAEFAIRDFLNSFPEQTYKQMMEWSKSDNLHQRRLASEGLRPKLPWAKAINIDYHETVKPLNNLYYDRVRYVTRSVANHMNDVSKINPDFCIKTLAKWQQEGKQTDKEMTYIIKHALRTLIKKGHPDALALLGFHHDPQVRVDNLVIENPEIHIGDSISFTFDVIAEADEKLVIDFKVIYPLPTGKHSEKVFKLKTASMNAGETLHITKRHAFRKMTTKKLYTGEYALLVQINGKAMANTLFHLFT